MHMDGTGTAEPTVVALSGELCIAEMGDVRAVIESTINAGARDLVLDLADTTLVTAAALRVFATTANRLEGLGGSFQLRNPSPLTLRVLEITGFERLLGPAVAA